MRKTLLIAASALAASIISSQAGVYSQNIVGYVNTPLPAGGFANINNPLDESDANGLNDSVTNFLPVFSGNLDGSLIVIWNGAGYTTYTIDSGQPSGIGNAADTAPVNPPPVITPGTGFFLENTTSASQTNTFVGTVHVEGTSSTNVVGLTTNSIANGHIVFLASKLPIGGGISSALQLPKDGSLDGSLIYIPNIVSGQIHGFNTITVDSGQPTGFGDPADVNPVAEPTIPVGAGFLFENTTASAVNWVQSY